MMEPGSAELAPCCIPSASVCPAKPQTCFLPCLAKQRGGSAQWPLGGWGPWVCSGAFMACDQLYFLSSTGCAQAAILMQPGLRPFQPPSAHTIASSWGNARLLHCIILQSLLRPFGWCLSCQSGSQAALARMLQHAIPACCSRCKDSR